MNDIGCTVSKMWHEILMNSSTAEDVEKYPELMRCSPIEIQVILITGATPGLLLRDYISILHIPKSTFTSILDRLEKKQFIKRIISQKDRRSYGLELDKAGVAFLSKYTAYQQEIGARIISGLEEEEKQQLVGLLNKISSYMLKR